MKLKKIFSITQKASIIGIITPSLELILEKFFNTLAKQTNLNV